MEIRRIRQTEAEAVTDLWDESAGGVLKERGSVEERFARGDADLETELLQELGFEPEATGFGLYGESSTSNCTSSP